MATLISCVYCSITVPPSTSPTQKVSAHCSLSVHNDNMLYRVVQKTTPLCVTARIVKTYELIVRDFGRLQHYFVAITSVNSILNKFITSVAPPSDKIDNLVFRLPNHARPL